MSQNPRYLSVDVFRGITIVLMILVNSPGMKEVYPPLAHSVWDGCTLADLVFPFFIVLVGLSSVLSLKTMQARGYSHKQIYIHILKRTLVLMVLGLLLNAFPGHFSWNTLRLAGVLQRIALCYIFSAFMVIYLNWRWQMILAAFMVLVYGLLMAGFSGQFPLTPDGNFIGYWDRVLLKSQHLYTPNFDPEGLVSTLPALASVLSGNLLGYAIKTSASLKSKILQIALCGLILAILGWGTSYFIPLNKSLWSSSYVLWTSGLAYLVLAGCLYLIDYLRWLRWTYPFSLLGRHALLLYCLHVLVLKLQILIKIPNAEGEWVNLKYYLTQTLFGWMSPPLASLSYALSYTLFWFLLIKLASLRNQP